MTSPDANPMPEFIRKAGAELENAFRAKGQALPGGLTAEQFVAILLEDMRRDQ